MGINVQSQTIWKRILLKKQKKKLIENLVSSSDVMIKINQHKF